MMAGSDDADRGGCDPDAAPVAAVVVTHNRARLLAETLAAIAVQTRPPAYTIVVDNASRDNTPQVLDDEFPNVRRIVLARNIGGAGGFAAGVAAARTLPVRAIWLLDDDAIPDSTALERLVNAHEHFPGTPPGIVASHVIWTDGRVHPMNVPRRRRLASRHDRARARSLGCDLIRAASFCSLLVDVDAARSTDLPIADYFVWNDDFEYSARILRYRVGLLQPASVVVHKTATAYSSASAPGNRFYFDVRNMLWLLLRSRALSPFERAFFGVGAARRVFWAMTRATDRQRLRPQLRKGFWHGVLRRPRPTAAIIDAARGAGSVDVRD